MRCRAGAESAPSARRSPPAAAGRRLNVPEAGQVHVEAAEDLLAQRNEVEVLLLQEDSLGHCPVRKIDDHHQVGVTVPVNDFLYSLTSDDLCAVLFQIAADE